MIFLLIYKHLELYRASAYLRIHNSKKPKNLLCHKINFSILKLNDEKYQCMWPMWMQKKCCEWIDYYFSLSVCEITGNLVGAGNVVVLFIVFLRQCCASQNKKFNGQYFIGSKNMVQLNAPHAHGVFVFIYSFCSPYHFIMVHHDHFLFNQNNFVAYIIKHWPPKKKSTAIKTATPQSHMSVCVCVFYNIAAHPVRHHVGCRREKWNDVFVSCLPFISLWLLD